MKATLKAVFLLFTLFLVAGFFFSSPIAWPIERSIERSQIYSASRAHVAAAGGWAAVEKACLNYVTNGFGPNEMHNIYYMHGRRFATNSLPQTIDLLQPMFLAMTTDKNGAPIFQVILSCGHRTGGYDTPYYAIWIVCTNRPNYVPDFGTATFKGAKGMVERKGEAIFEAR